MFKNSVMPQQVITTGPGPEDMVLDLSGSPRLIISCGDFFNIGRPERSGAIYYYDIAPGTTGTFTIAGLPSGVEFFPHGIAILQAKEKLYVINHDRNASKTGNSILIFHIEGTTLRLSEPPLVNNDFLTTPNDITALEDGTLYITNEGGFSSWDIISRLFIRRSFVARYDPVKKNFSKAYNKVLVANGIHAIGNRIYIVDSFKSNLLVTEVQTDGSLALIKQIEVAKNLDNITSENGILYIPSHDSILKLTAAKKNHNVKPPFSVHRIDPVSGNTSVIYKSKHGKPISAVSTALSYNGNLYLSQIFDNYIIKI